MSPVADLHYVLFPFREWKNFAAGSVESNWHIHIPDSSGADIVLRKFGRRYRDLTYNIREGNFYRRKLL